MQGWHLGNLGLPSSYLSCSGENLGMSPVTVKSDDNLRTPKSSKLPPELPLTLFLGPNLISLESRPSMQAIVCTPSCFWELWGFFPKEVELSPQVESEHCPGTLPKPSLKASSQSTLKTPQGTARCREALTPFPSTFELECNFKGKARLSVDSLCLMSPSSS